MITQEEKERIAHQLNERIAEFKCPMCGNQHFIIADGYFCNILHDDMSRINLSGPNIPTISIVCNRCGFVSQHALGILGLMPNNQQNNNTEGGNNGE